VAGFASEQVQADEGLLNLDPRDAGDLLAAAFDELDLPMPDRDQAFVAATAFVAWAVHTGNLPPPYAVRWAYRSRVQWDPPAGPPELFRLGDLDDDHSLAERRISVRSIDEADDDVRVLAARRCRCRRRRRREPVDQRGVGGPDRGSRPAGRVADADDTPRRRPAGD
jgi:hypothetical protein